MLYIKNEDGCYRIADEDDVIEEATHIYNGYFAKGTTILNPADSADYLKLKLAHFEHEVFLCLFLTNHNQVISCDEMFHGTIDSASVYPREVVKLALQYNAAAVVFSHNHPSGIEVPSRADKEITNKLKKALEIVDIRVLDHIIIGDSTYSFAEHGLL